ncbi:MAG: ATP synthase F1 subunit gamma [Candidatus Sumerlaeia bacterium]|nr:ATP synthase F1 subunit gamma [Candidatus Sumerlaeia bacterium]
MVEDLKKLRRRIRSLRNTQKITRALEMVSASKFRRAEESWNSAKPYYLFLRRIIARLLANREKFQRFVIEHPFFQSNDEQSPDCLVLITSDRGLCGAFNSNLIQYADEFLHKQSPEKKIVIYAIGRRGFNHFRRQGAEIIGTALELAARFELETVEKIATELETLFLQKKINTIYLLFSRFISRTTNRPVIETLLPINPEILVKEEDLSEAETRLDYIIEPNIMGLIVELLPAYVRSRVAQTLLEAFTAEHSARMLAMTNATRNCGELLDELTLKMNKARQSAITRELLDIISGAEALRKMQE